VPKPAGLMCQACSAFEVFDNSDRDLTQFVKIRVFHKCDQFLVPWPRDVDPELTWPGIRWPWSSRVVGYRVPPDTWIFLRSQQIKCPFVSRHMARLLLHAKLCNLRFLTLIESCVPPSLFWTMCPGCKILHSSSPAKQSLSQLRPRCCLYINKTNAT
jgi:hypothetical protein